MIQINDAKAREIAKNKIREWRKDEFAKNDILIQNALVDDDTEKKKEGVDRRTYLRDLPSECDGKNHVELASLLRSLGVITK